MEAVDAVCGAGSRTMHRTTYVVVSRRVTASSSLLAALCVRRNCNGAATGASDGTFSSSENAMNTD